MHNLIFMHKIHKNKYIYIILYSKHWYNILDSFFNISIIFLRLRKRSIGRVILLHFNIFSIWTLFFFIIKIQVATAFKHIDHTVSTAASSYQTFDDRSVSPCSFISSFCKFFNLLIKAVAHLLHYQVLLLLLLEADHEYFTRFFLTFYLVFKTKDLVLIFAALIFKSFQFCECIVPLLQNLSLIFKH